MNHNIWNLILEKLDDTFEYDFGKRYKLYNVLDIYKNKKIFFTTKIDTLFRSMDLSKSLQKLKDHEVNEVCVRHFKNDYCTKISYIDDNYVIYMHNKFRLVLNKKNGERLIDFLIENII